MTAAHNDKPSAEQELVAAAHQEAAELAESARSSRPIASIAGYTIIREIGRGGMGVIYEAQQIQPPRPVALKVIRSGSVSKHRLMLFRQEVEKQARLHSPSIPAIYEAGRTDDGRPYFAMELVRGVPLGEYVGLEQLNPRNILHLFRRICEAIHYAHQRGIIHRDLKPSNIIIDADGNPKVVDFGLARITDADEADQTGFTEAGKIMGTLPYMSPEQVRGRPEEIDIRTDIYSLGLILYELLTGSMPYSLSGLEPDKVRRIIREQPPRRPSTIKRALRGDLEIILLKTLEKDPAQRYQSAAALADDIDHYLKNEPVLAHPDSVIYQLRKLVARYKLLSTYVLTLIALIVGFGIWMSILYAETRQLRQDDHDRQRAVIAWRKNTLSGHRKELLTLRMELAISLTELGKYAAAEPLLRTCRHIRRGTLDEPPWLTAYTENLLGECLTGLGQYEEAEPLLLSSYPLLEEHPEQARAALRRIIDLYEAWGRPDQAAEWRGVKEGNEATRQPGTASQPAVAETQPANQPATQPAAELEDELASGSD